MLEFRLDRWKGERVTDRSFTLDAREILAADDIHPGAVWRRLAAGDETGVTLLRLAFDITLFNGYAWASWQAGNKAAMLGYLYQGNDTHEEYKKALQQWQQPTQPVTSPPNQPQPQELRR
jgi:hypothetical protein